ncbi:GTP cyclohydrolase [Flavobacteriaceae sp. LMIT009]
MIEVKEIHSKKDLKKFVKFPFSLYKDSDFWIPPIINEEVRTFDKNINPVFDNADGHFFLAYKNGKIVGRIAALINWIEVKDQGIKKMRFGWFDVINDVEVTKALLEKVNEIGKANNLEFIEGPIGFSNLDKVGVVYEGNDHIGSMITWENHPYYVTHLESLGYTFGKGYSESKFKFADIDPTTFKKVSALIKRRYGYKVVKFNSTKDILPRANEMFDVFAKSHSVLESFVDINDRQKEYFKKKFIGFLDPEFVQFVTDKDDKLIAFAIVTPSFATALQKMKGKLWPFGFRHLLHAKKHIAAITFYLIGVLPEHQNKGVTAIIFDEYYKEFEKKGVIDCIRGPELDENTAIHQLWRHFNPKTFKRRCTYKKNII